MPPMPEPVLPPEADALPAQPAPAPGTAASRSDAASFTARFFPRFRALSHGCYLLRYTPTTSSPISFSHYDGTLRVERRGVNTIASGDLYRHLWFSWPGSPPSPEPSPSAGIPIFPIKRYRYYLRVTKILEAFTLSNNFTLGFERYLFNHATKRWTNEGTFTAQMTWASPPAGYPSGADYLTGSVKDTSGTVVGLLTMGWISRYLRRAVVEIDRVNASESPGNNGAGLGWRAAFEQVDWDLTVVESESNLAEPSGESWSDAEMHAAMLAHRAKSNLDEEWRYHMLCVRRLDSTSRGIMYDTQGSDSNNVPREGVGIASHWMIPNTSTWGLVKGMRFGAATAPYFRTALHECGHALGLYHNTSDNGLMNTTNVIASTGTTANPFPNNILWSFAADDAKRLRHLPDMWVRPGGTAFGSAYATAPLSPDDREDAVGLSLRVGLVLDSVPIGAPARVELTLENQSDYPLMVPSSLSLKRGAVRGRVVDPAGTVRTFRSILQCIEDHELRTLGPHERMSGSMTLLRGAEGSLFPTSGAYRISVDVEWEVDGVSVGVTGEASLMVTGAVDQEHAAIALEVISTPDALLALALGGDHLTGGIEAIHAGLRHPVLRPHFAFIEARRLGRSFMNRRAELEAATRLIDEEIVLSEDEIRKAARLVRQAGEKAASTGRTHLASVLWHKASEMHAQQETLDEVEQLRLEQQADERGQP